MKKKILAVALSTLMVCTLTAALYACGGEDPNATYTVTYAKSDLGETGTLPTDENEYKKGDKVTLKAANFLELDNYHFVGWNDGTTTYEVTDEYTMPAKNVTFKAVWKMNGYSASFSNSRTDRDNIVVLGDEYQEGDEITLIEKPADFTDENGRVFSGWYTVQNETVTYYEVGDTYTIPAHDVEFYAYWKATSIIATFYLEQGVTGEKYATKTYAIGDSIIIEFPQNPADKEVDGKKYEFDGWYRSDNEDIEFTINTVFTDQDKEYGAIALFAKWKEKSTSGGEQGGEEEGQTFTVYYFSTNMQGVTLKEEEYKAGETVTVLGKLEGVEEEGEFLGWYTNTTEYSVGDTFAMPEQDVYLFPLIEEENIVPVYFFIDFDATFADLRDVVEGEEPYLTLIEVEPNGFADITIPDITSFEVGKYADGYRFEGWFYADADEEWNAIDSPFNNDYILNEDHLDWGTGGLYVYAMWTPISE